MPSVKLTRRVLLGVIILTLASILFNYFHTWRSRSQKVSRPARILSAEMKRSASEVDYVEYRGTPRVPKFRIHAKLAQETQTGKNLLEGIDACDFNTDGSVRNEIRSLKAEYDPVGKKTDFSGDVRVLINKKIELRTNSLHYDMDAEVGSTPDLMTFISDQIRGTARGVRFEQKLQSLELLSQVDLTILHADGKSGDPGGVNQVRATAGRALCSEKAGRILLEGNARLVSEAQWLSGEHIEAMLDSEHKRIRSLTAEGNSLYSSTAPGESRSLGGERLVFEILDGALKSIAASGQAMFSTATSAESQNLKAGAIDIRFDAKQLPTQINARTGVAYQSSRGSDQIAMAGDQLDAAFVPGTRILQWIQIRKQAGASPTQAAMKMGAGNASGSELQADDIRLKIRDVNGRSVLETLRAEGTARYISKPMQKDGSPGPARSLSASLLELSASKSGDYFDSGSASGKVVFSEDSSSSEAGPQLKRMNADRARFQFFPGNNLLKHVDAEGNVQLAYERRGNAAGAPVEKSRTYSDNMKAEFALQAGKSEIESALQWGRFRYEDGLRTASSGKCDYSAARQLLILTESPRLSDEEKSTTGDRIEYDQGKKLLLVRGRVRSVFRSQKGSGSLFAPDSSSSTGIVKSEEMSYWMDTGRAQYINNVHLLSDNQNLQADSLEISKGMEQVIARGAVRHLISRKENSGASQASERKSGQSASDILSLIQSATMTYLKDRNSINYSGKVKLHSREADIFSDEMDAVPDAQGKKIRQATAKGNVMVQYGARSCKGDVADYYLDSKKLVVTGKPAEFNDPVKGRSYARRLTSTTADDTILLEN